MAAGRRRKQAIAPQLVSEIIGRAVYGPAQASLYRSRTAITTVDATVPDYAFYDQLRRGKQPGYKLGALFAKRIERIFTHWIFGRGVTVALAEPGNEDDENNPRTITDGLLSDFMQVQHGLLMTVKEDALGLGDQYIFVNADGSLSVPSPDTVEVERDPLDYRTVLRVTITTKLPAYTITDSYMPTERTVTVKKGAEVQSVTTYPVLIGRIPYVHIAHGMSGNETNGHSIHEDLLKLYDQYDDVIHKQLDGAKLLGNPILSFTGLEDLTAVVDANKPVTPETYIDQGGVEVTRPMLNIDSTSIMLVGKGGDAKFVAPPVGFSADTQQSLKTLFLLLLDRTGIPEFIWGNELSSARASSDTQMMQWAHDIEGMQKGDERWLLDLCTIMLLYAALTEPGIVVDKLVATWPPVLDENQEMKLKAIEMAVAANLLTRKTHLELLQLVDDAAEEVAQAEEEAQARAEQEQERMPVQPETMPPVAQMNGNGYHAIEVEGLIDGAIRHLVGDGYAN